MRENLDRGTTLTRLAALATLSHRAGLSGELNLIARLASRSTKIMPADTSPSPPFRGEREGPDPQGWEGEVGGATNRLVGSPHPTLSPGQRGERGKGARRQQTLSKGCFFNFPRTCPAGARMRSRSGREATGA